MCVNKKALFSRKNISGEFTLRNEIIISYFIFFFYTFHFHKTKNSDKIFYKRGNGNEIIKTTVEIIKDSYFKDREGFNFPYEGGSIIYSFDVSANNYEENMNKLR